MDGALADFECGTQVRRRHVRGNRFVAEKIDPPKNVNDTACPRARLPRSERARALPAEHFGHRACQVPVFRAEVLVTNVVSQADDLLVDRQHLFWNRVQARGDQSSK